MGAMNINLHKKWSEMKLGLLFIIPNLLYKLRFVLLKSEIQIRDVRTDIHHLMPQISIIISKLSIRQGTRAYMNYVYMSYLFDLLPRDGGSFVKCRINYYWAMQMRRNNKINTHKDK